MLGARTKANNHSVLSCETMVPRDQTAQFVVIYSARLWCPKISTLTRMTKSQYMHGESYAGAQHAASIGLQNLFMGDLNCFTHFLYSISGPGLIVELGNFCLISRKSKVLLELLYLTLLTTSKVVLTKTGFCT